MNLFWREMKASRKSLIIWSIGAVLLVLSGMNKYGTLYGSDQSVNELLRDMPKSLQALFGIGSADLSTIQGYFGMLFIYMALLATIHAAMLGAGILAKEERDRTVEFLLTKPISRNAVVTAKLLAALANAAVVTLVTWGSSAVSIRQYGKEESMGAELALLMLGLFLLQLVFLSIGAALAAAGRNPKRAGGIAAGLLLASYLLSVVIRMSGRLEGLRFATPFQYISAERILSGGGLEPAYAALAAAVSAVLLAVAYRAYRKRDMRV